MTFSKTFLIILLLNIVATSYAQLYIPDSSYYITTSNVILEYYFVSGANRPSADFKFKDGFVINLNAVSEGEYSWCIRVYKDSTFENLGSLKMEFSNNNNLITIYTKIDFNDKYKKYLDLLPRSYKRINE